MNYYYYYYYRDEGETDSFNLKVSQPWKRSKVLFFFFVPFLQRTRVTNAVYVKRACTRTGEGACSSPAFFSIPKYIAYAKNVFPSRGWEQNNCSFDGGEISITYAGPEPRHRRRIPDGTYTHTYKWIEVEGFCWKIDVPTRYSKRGFKHAYT